jgi:hypothetical protein
MLFEYSGFTIHRMGASRYMVIGYGFIGYETSVKAARNLIDCLIAGQCAE